MHLSTSRRALAAGSSLLLAFGLVTLASPSGAERLCTLQQVTGLDGSSVDVNLSDLRVSADGSVAVFSSDDAIDGANGDGSSEVWRLDLTTREIEPITNTTGGFANDPAVDGDGDLIAFTSNRNFTNENVDASQEVFLYDVDADDFTQLSTGGFNSFDPAVSADGTHVAFTTDGNPIGTNADGNLEAFLHTVGGSTIALTTTTIGHGSIVGGIDADGSRVSFTSNADLVGTNADENTEVFVRDVTGAVTTQATTTVGGGSGTFTPVLDADGTTIAFGSNRDLDAGQNADGDEELFVGEVAGGGFDQLTNGTTDEVPAHNPRLSADGGTVAWFGPEDPLGTNADDNVELWLQDLTDDDPIQLTNTTSDFAHQGLDLDAAGRPLLATSFDPSLDGNGARNLYRRTCSGEAQAFTDVAPSHPFFDEISWMAAAGISTGFPPGPTYRPGTAVSRGAMSAFMFRLADSPPFDPPAQPTFGDISAGHPFFAEIEWMAAAGITTGTAASPKPLYRPASPVSRSAMSAFMFRLGGGGFSEPPAQPTFGDVAPSHPFYEEIEWMAEEGITTGTAASPKPLYKPAAAVSRAAMSAFMFRLADGPGVQV
jgi:Tol biopolymer transport system component